MNSRGVLGIYTMPDEHRQYDKLSVQESYKEQAYDEEGGTQGWVDYAKEKKLDPKTSKEGKLKVCSKALHPKLSYPLIAVAELSLEKGYEPLNWLNPENKVTALYLIEAAQRHLDQVKLGIDLNTQERRLDGYYCTNKPYHAAQVAYNMLMLVRQIEEGVLIDDRLFKDGELKE